MFDSVCTLEKYGPNLKSPQQMAMINFLIQTAIKNYGPRLTTARLNMIKHDLILTVVTVFEIQAFIQLCDQSAMRQQVTKTQ